MALLSMLTQMKSSLPLNVISYPCCIVMLDRKLLTIIWKCSFMSFTIAVGSLRLNSSLFCTCFKSTRQQKFRVPNVADLIAKCKALPDPNDFGPTLLFMPALLSALQAFACLPTPMHSEAPKPLCFNLSLFCSMETSPVEVSFVQ